MKTVIALALAVISAAGTARGEVQPVNAVIGDASFVATYGKLPTADTPETLRIETHLRFVHRLLSHSTPSHISPDLRRARQRNLDRLARYIDAGVFPINTLPLQGRRPVFIDHVGTRCAVAAIAEYGVGAGAVTAIAGRHRYSYLPDIAVPALAQWQSSSGFTPIELAMIQPAYAYANFDVEGTATSPVPLLTSPGGDGESLIDQGFWLNIRVYDAFFDPVQGIPAFDFWLIDCDPNRDLYLCAGSNSASADHATSANGVTKMSLTSPAIGGCADGVALVVQGMIVMDSLSGYATIKCAPIYVRSPDISGDGRVDLVDLAALAEAYTPLPYDDCSDLDINGVVNLQDLALFAFYYGPPGSECT